MACDLRKTGDQAFCGILFAVISNHDGAKIVGK
jgi:hypothetical protein